MNTKILFAFALLSLTTFVVAAPPNWKYALAIDVSREPSVVLKGVMYVTLVYENGTEYEMHSPKDTWYPGRNLNYFLEDFESTKIKNVNTKFVAETEPITLEQLFVMRMQPTWFDRCFCGEKRPFLMTNGTWFTLTNKC